MLSFWVDPSFGNMVVELNVFNVVKQLGDLEDVREVNLIESTLQEHFERQCIEHSFVRMLMFGASLDCLEVGDNVCEDSKLEV